MKRKMEEKIAKRRVKKLFISVLPQDLNPDAYDYKIFAPWVFLWPEILLLSKISAISVFCHNKFGAMF